MFHLIDRVREKPKGERKVLAFGIAGAISGVIFIIWLLSFVASLAGQQKNQENKDDNFSFGSFFQSFEEVSNIFQEETVNIKEQFNEFNASVELLQLEADVESVEEDLSIELPKESRESTTEE